MLKTFLLPTLSFLLIGLSACAQSSNPGSSESSTAIAASPTTTAQQPATTPPKASATNLTPLFSRIWRVTKAPSTPASGSIYIFLPNGTLLQTSCTEPYRIAGWRVDKAAPRVLRVTEDGQLAYTAAITQLSDTTLQLQRTLIRSNEKQALTLAAVQREFVCPDLRR